MAIRDAWLGKRLAAAAAENGNRNLSQMHYARLGVITEEMSLLPGARRSSRNWCAARSRAGAASFPPMSITVRSSRWASAWRFGARSTPTSEIPRLLRKSAQELEKLHNAVHYGSDTVMDLSTGGDIPTIRKAIIEASPVPVGTVPIYEALSRVKRTEDLSADLMLEVIEEQAEQGVDYMTIHAGVRREFLPWCATALPE